MSKESRRAARAARESRRLGVSGSARPTGATDSTDRPAASGAGRTSGGGSASGSDTRAGRRDRVRRYHEPTFLEKYRTLLIGVAGVAILAVVVGVVFLGATQPVFACTNVFDPSPTPSVSPGSSTRLGFIEEDMGNSHVVSKPQKYLFCPPASGNHLNAVNLGPILAHVYKPDDSIGPPNWIHNLEHGAMVILYRNDSPGATAAGLAAFKTFYDTFPPSPICKIPAGQLSPVVARFDQMPHAYAALVWDRVLYMDTWDPDLALRFYAEESERLDADGALVAPPEKQCNPQASAAPSSGTSESPAASVEPSAAASVEPTVAPSASPEPSPSAS